MVRDVICDVVFTNSLRKFYCLNLARIIKNVFIAGNCRLEVNRLEVRILDVRS